MATVDLPIAVGVPKYFVPISCPSAANHAVDVNELFRVGTAPRFSQGSIVHLQLYTRHLTPNARARSER
jgi:hypothetical protein